MKALIAARVGHIEISDIAPPEIGPYEALVRMEVCGICNSTDQKLIDGTMFWAPPFPFVLGHESVGRVVQLGSQVRNFALGDRVTRPLYKSTASLNSANGGFAEYGFVTDIRAMASDGDPSLLSDYNGLRQLVVPPSLSARDAALCISLSETASVLRHLPNPRGLKIAVAGTGVAGLAFALWFKLAGAHVSVLGRRDERLQLARSIGADAIINTSDPQYLDSLRDSAHGPLDGLIEATGNIQLASSLLSVLKPEGFACAYGVPTKELSYDARWETPEVEEHLSYAWVADLLIRDWIKPEWFISHEWDFGDIIEAFGQSQRGEVVKGFVHFGSCPI
jgi:threonine dehydrogenase-like Zn-dependent dehydrogenase